MLGSPKPRDYVTKREKKGLTQLRPVVVWAGIILIVVLLAAILLLTDEGKKLIPGYYNPRQNSQILLHLQEAAA